MEGILALMVGCGGFIGASTRYLALAFCTKNFKNPISYGTLIVNVIGAILIGFVVQLSLVNIVSPKIKLFITTGIFGGLTTFSTFSLESINLFTSGKVEMGIVNVVLNLFLSLIGVMVGQAIVKLIVA
ncbi:fluoride efflux transporter CrcB [Clostridium baratii]|uniref:fluoride efflux transporter CrcB n=1 Tax=Clostridium baratii TaxID=1561 RepID=UPI0030D2556E